MFVKGGGEGRVVNPYRRVEGGKGLVDLHTGWEGPQVNQFSSNVHHGESHMQLPQLYRIQQCEIISK